MKAPLSWLRDYVKIDIDIKEYCDMMTMSGSKVEGFESPFHEISKVVTGKIVELGPHPDADKLVVSEVDVGNETIRIVTGAKNVKTGDIIPVALHGSTLPGGIKITKGKLRGVESNGMMCSISELNLTKNDFPEAVEDGIFILPENTPLGKDIKEVLGLDDTVVDFEITSNRPDCFSLIGLARESAVTLGQPFINKQIVVKEEGHGNSNDYAKVTIEDYDLCPRYCGKVITDVVIRKSPLWMRKRLRDAGVRPINNIVDITNYVMLEYGQPMHAFDLDYINDKHIIVRRASDGEKMNTLDDQERVLNVNNLVIADGKQAVAVAGVMGGADSEVNDNTRNILFESANFKGVNVRLTAKQLGLRTESSARFEKGLDPYNTKTALLRACELVEMIGVGKVVPGMIDNHQSLPEKRVIPFNAEKINRFLGTDISSEQMIQILESLEFKVDIKKMEAYVPTFRPDVEAWADIAEEIVRFYGYNNIQSSLMSGEQATQGEKTYQQKIKDIIKNTMVSLGLMETYTYSFTSRKVFDKLMLSTDSPLRNTVVIQNPLGEDFSIMRTTTVPEMLQVISHNDNRRIYEGMFFETAYTYHPVKNEKLPEEKNVLTIGLYGKYSFLSIKGMVETLLESLGINEVIYVAETDNAIYHPGRCAAIMKGDRKIGVIGEIHPDVEKNFGTPKRVIVGEISIDILVELADMKKNYKSLPKYPEMDRDLALVVDEEILAFELETAIRENGGKLLEKISLFDVYRSEQLGDNKKSMAYSLTFRADDRTLTDEEVNNALNKILKKLKERFNAVLR
ncbi:MAG: phenylalanine--tRNA ligase subunit beta [Clostridia bacterium]|nr:phenylalanine--tRNA ligase subunit beta [Clostridia bacterium]